MGVRDYELEEDYGRRGRDGRWRDDDRDYDRPRVWRKKRDDEREEPRKEPLGKREPVRIAGAVATLISAAALALGVEFTDAQANGIRELILLAIPIIVPIIASFEIARSKVDSPATVERKLRERRRR